MNEELFEEYPTLKQLRAIKEEHGPLTEVSYNAHASGMMMGDVSSDELKLIRQDGKLRLMRREMKRYSPIVTSVYEADESLMERLQEMSDRENLPLWEHLKADPEKMMQVLDYSSGSSIMLKYDDTEINGHSTYLSCFDREAALQQGGEKVFDEIASLLFSGIREERLLETASEPNPYVKNISPFMTINQPPVSEPDDSEEKEFVIAEDGSWKCPSCGAEGNTGKFCAECGSRGPEE